MSYLNALRLHFAGRFQANISTVNNDPVHFYNEAFQPSWQDLQGPNFDPPNGWFSPEGDVVWRLLGCKVTAAWLPTGAADASDPVLTCIIADSDRQAPAKLVDLDPEQQLVFEIWGLQVRIADAAGNTLLLSDFEHAAFMDIWDRAQGQTQGGDVDAGAMYQSVLKNLQWGDVSKSAFLKQLKDSGGLLSIKFNVDNINMDNTSTDFLTGRIVGTIGPATATEPQHFVLGRHFLAATYGGGNFFVPAGGLNHCVAAADGGTLFLDLGNALPTVGTSGAPVDLGELTLGLYDTSGGTPYATGAVTPLGTISGYASNDWYSKTAGVVALPLTTAQQQSIAAAPLVLSSANAAFIDEWPTGVFVTADTFVYRMSPGDSVEMKFYMTQWGQPVAGATVSFALDASQLQIQAGTQLPPPFAAPQVGVPTDALQFGDSATTDANGIATLTVTATDPGTPRNFNDGKDYGIDGQVYGIRPSLSGQYGGGPVDPWNFVSILLWSAYSASKPVTWNDIAPTMVQYANLYPVMNRFLNLGDYDSVVAHAHLLTLAFSLDNANPNAMPVTRDLSPAKRQAILAFLANPQRGEVKMLKAAPRAVPAEAVTPAAVSRKGGKAAAAARRLVHVTMTMKGPRS